MANPKTVQVDDAILLFRNFEGRESQYNRAGDRNFAVVLDDEIAERMHADGWNVKELASRDEGDDPRPYISVAVGYKYKPPTIVMITSSGRKHLTEETVGVLDFVDIAKADLIFREYAWGPINGKSGVKAYLQSLYVTVQEDELAIRYAETNDQ